MNYHQEKVRGSAWGPSRHLSVMFAALAAEVLLFC